MKSIKSILATFALALATVVPSVAWAEKISKHKDPDGWEEWYWTKTVKVSRGSAHTFWITGLTENTAITDIELFYVYKEDGETMEDSFGSESTEVENSSGGFDKYVLMTADEWEWVDESKKSITLTVKVSGWEPDEDQSSADISFTFGHSDGDADFPGDVEPPAPPAPKGSQDNPQSITPKEVANPSTEATMTDCPLADDLGGTYYIKTSNLVAGHKYFLGIDNGSDMTIAQSVGGANLFKDETCSKEYEGFSNCTEAYSFVAPASGVYWITVNVESDFVFYSAALPALAPDKHAFVDLAVGTESGEFSPGYLNNPESGAYDEVIDEQLFRVTGYKKGDNLVFRTDGAAADLLMRLYDSKGVVLAESKRMGDDSQEVQVVWTATANYAASGAAYLGVCQQLEDGEEPSSGPVTVSVQAVALSNHVTPLSVVPDGSERSPVDAEGVEPSEERTLSATEWVNSFVIAARAGIKYRVKATCANPNGLALGANVYTLSGTSKKALSTKAGLSGSLDPSVSRWLEFTAEAHGNVYIDVFVQDGEYGSGKGLEYGPYAVCASAAGASLGILTTPMKGAPQDDMGWKIISGPGITASKEVFYAAGTSAILPAGDYTLVAKEVKGFAKPDAKGYATAHVDAGTVPTLAEEYKYTDTADPLDDSPDAKAKHPTLNKAYAPTKLAPTATKPAVADRTLWVDDPADWYVISAAAGCYYRFAFTAKTGAPKMAVYGPDSWTTSCAPVIFDDPCDVFQICAAKKGTYYLKVYHDESDVTDSSYSLCVSMANPGLVKFAKTAVSAKDNAAHVDLPVSRSSKDGVVRVKYRTVGAQTDKDDAYYYPTNGILTWAAGDSKAQNIRVRLVPAAGWTTNKVVKVVLEAFATDDETFDAATEYPATFDVDKKGNVLDVATITIAATAKKVPGTIQVAGSATPKKPILSVAAGETIDIPFERVLGADGVIGVKVETVKGTANKSGEVDFTPVTTELVWQEGETDAKVVSVSTKKAAGDYTAVKTFTLKLTALTSKKGDAVQYDKPTIASATVTVNIMNDKFAAAFDDYAKTITDAADGYTVKAGKKDTWVVMPDGSFFAPNKGDLTFTFKTTGKFTYRVDGGEAQVFNATAANKSLPVKGKSTFEIVSYELDGEPVALRQGVKYEASFGKEGTVKATNLPGGLKLAQDKATKEWTLSGVPSKAGVFQATYTTTIDKKTPAVVSNVCYSVAAQGASAGTFTGLATTYDTTNGVPALASVTITAALGGKLSAKVTISGKSYAFADTGYSYAESDPTDPDAPAFVTAKLSFVSKIGTGKTTASVTNWLYYTVMDVPETDAAGWCAEGEVEIQMAALPDAKGNGYQEDVWYFGSVFRDNSKSAKAAKEAWEAAMAAHAGYYTVALVSEGTYGEPQGSGYVTMTLDAKGKAKLAGKLADGTAYSASVTAALAGEPDSPSVRVPLFACKGSYVFGGWLSIKAGEDGTPVATLDSPDTDLVWKNDDPASTRDGEEGFALYLYPVGGWYDTVLNLQRSYLESDLFVDVPEGEDALAEIMDALALPDGYGFVAQPSGQTVDLLGNNLSVGKQVLVKDAAKKFNDWAASVNTSNVKLTFKRATGVVSGTFDLWYEGIAEGKTAKEQKSISGLKHEGVVILSRGDDGYLADDILSSGFFLAPQTFKETVGKKTVTRKWTGSYRFDIRATPVAVDWADAAAE